MIPDGLRMMATHGTEPKNLILRYLRGLDEGMTQLRHDVSDIKVRISAIETQLGVITTQIAGIGVRLDRLECRAGLIDAPS